LKKITATELKNRLGQYLDEIERGPVVISKTGREKAVLMSFASFANKNRIEMKVRCHDSGRYSLMEKHPGDIAWTAVPPPSRLFGNTDAAVFYQAVAERIAMHSAQGTLVVNFEDIRGQ
jgi:prevent-host-death family protein